MFCMKFGELKKDAEGGDFTEHKQTEFSLFCERQWSEGKSRARSKRIGAQLA